MTFDSALTARVHKHLLAQGVAADQVTDTQVQQAAQAIGVRVPLRDVTGLKQAVVAHARRLIDADARTSVQYGARTIAGGGVGVQMDAIRQASGPAPAAKAPTSFDPLRQLPSKAAYSAKEYLQAATAHRGYLDKVLAEVKQLQQENTQRAAELTSRMTHARDTTSAQLLPEATSAALAALAKRLVVPGLMGLDPAQRISARKAALAADKAALLGRLGGSSPQQLAEQRATLTQRLKTAEQGLARLAGNADVADLERAGYKTERYTGGLLSPKSWNDGAQEKRALKAFPEFSDWGALTAHLNAQRAAVRETRAALEALVAPVDALAIEARAAKLDVELASVEQDVLRELWRTLGQHLESADPAQLTKALEGHPAASELARFLGTKHQLAALDGVGRTPLAQLEASVRAELKTLTQDLAAMTKRPPKGQVSRAQLEERFSKRANTLGRTVNTVAERTTVVHQYSSYSPGMTFWDYMFWGSMLSSRSPTETHHHHYHDAPRAGGGDFGGGGASGSWADAQSPASAATSTGTLGVAEGLAQSLPLFEPLPTDLGFGQSATDPLQSNAFALPTLDGLSTSAGTFEMRFDTAPSDSASDGGWGSSSADDDDGGRGAGVDDVAASRDTYDTSSSGGTVDRS